MIIELISYMSFFSLKVNNDDKNNNLFRVCALNILIPLNVLHAFYTKILYREKRTRCPDLTHWLASSTWQWLEKAQY